MLLLFFLLLICVCNAQWYSGNVVPTVHQFRVTMSAAHWTQITSGSTTTEYSCTITYRGKSYPGSEIEQHGGYARSLPKKSVRLTFPRKNEPNLDLFQYDNANRHSHRRLVLKSAFIEPTFMIDKLVHDTSRDLGGLSPRATYGELFVNGNYYGLFVVFERIDGHFLQRQGLTDWKLEGNLYKAITHDGDWFPKSSMLKGISQKYGTAVASNNGANDLIPTMQALDTVPRTFDDWEVSIRRWLDLETVFPYHISHTFAGECDGYDKNYYTFADADRPERPFSLIGWDADCSYGNKWQGEIVDVAAQIPRLVGFQDAISRYFAEIPEYSEAYYTRYAQLLTDPSSPLSNAALNKKIDLMAQVLAPHVDRDYQQWKDTYNNARGYSSTAPRLRWTAAVARLRAAHDTRRAVQLGRLNGTIAQSGPGTRCTWTACGACNNSTMCANVLSDITVTELQTRAPSGAPDFIELRNIGSTPRDLTGWYFANGIQFYFSGAPAERARNILAPNAFLILAGNETSFAEYYPSVPASVLRGQYRGRLDGDSERVKLMAPFSQTPAFDFTYSRGGNWPGERDSNCRTHSLVLKNQRGAPSTLNNGTNWRFSSAPKGSPGVADPAGAVAVPCSAIPKIYVNEVMSNPSVVGQDWIELYNDETQSTDLVGWHLRDSERGGNVYDLPADSVIPAKGFLVLRQADFGFGLSSLGESVYIESPDGAWRQGFSFGGASVDVSIGRHTTSDGSDHFVPLSRPTPLQPNAYPATSNLAINAIDLAVHSIELIARRTVNVTGWTLRGDVDSNLDGLLSRKQRIIVSPLYDDVGLRGAVTLPNSPDTRVLEANGELSLAVVRSAAQQTLRSYSDRITIHMSENNTESIDELHLLGVGDSPTTGGNWRGRVPVSSSADRLQRLSIDLFADEPTNWFSTASGTHAAGCTSAADCPDSPCHTKSCANYNSPSGASSRQCRHQPIACPGTFSSPCVEPAAVCLSQFDTGCQFVWLGGPGCCQTDADCRTPEQLGLACAPTCQNFACVDPPTNCCETVADCDDSVDCTIDQCINNVCNNVACTPAPTPNPTPAPTPSPTPDPSDPCESFVNCEQCVDASLHPTRTCTFCGATGCIDASEMCNETPRVDQAGVCPTPAPTPAPTPSPTPAPTPAPTPVMGDPCSEFVSCGQCVDRQLTLPRRCSWCATASDDTRRGSCIETAMGESCTPAQPAEVNAAAQCVAPTGTLPPTSSMVDSSDATTTTLSPTPTTAGGSSSTTAQQQQSESTTTVVASSDGDNTAAVTDPIEQDFLDQLSMFGLDGIFVLIIFSAIGCVILVSAVVIVGVICRKRSRSGSSDAELYTIGGDDEGVYM